MRLLVAIGSVVFATTLTGAAYAEDAEADADLEASADEDATPQDDAGEQDAEEEASEDDAEDEASEEEDGGEESEPVRPESGDQLGSSACSVSSPAPAASAGWLIAAASAALLIRRSRRC